MRVIAINEYGNDWPVSVVKLCGTAEETFIAWIRKYNKCPYEWTDARILEEALYVYSELSVIELTT